MTALLSMIWRDDIYFCQDLVILYVMESYGSKQSKS